MALTHPLHHICFVSDHNVAELLGALLPGPGRVQVHAIATPAMQPKAAHLASACRRHGIKCELHSLPAIAIPEIENLLDEIWYAASYAAWAVNITGGKKLMSLAAWAWAMRNRIPAFYVDTAAGQIQVFDNSAWRSEPLPDLLKFETLLTLYGYEIAARVSNPVDQDTRSALLKINDFFLDQTGSRAIHALNDRASRASERDLAVVWRPDESLARLLAICKQAGKLDYTDDRIIFRDEGARDWCMGGWLEEYVQSVLARLENEGQLTSWACRVEINGQGGPNELDAVFTAKNRLHVIECKTEKLQKNERVTPILYKADSIKGRMGGLHAKFMLCAIDSLAPWEAKRAANLGIRTVVGPGLRDLRKILLEWINGD